MSFYKGWSNFGYDRFGLTNPNSWTRNVPMKTSWVSTTEPYPEFQIARPKILADIPEEDYRNGHFAMARINQQALNAATQYIESEDAADGMEGVPSVSAGYMTGAPETQNAALNYISEGDPANPVYPSSHGDNHGLYGDGTGVNASYGSGLTPSGNSFLDSLSDLSEGFSDLSMAGSDLVDRTISAVSGLFSGEPGSVLADMSGGAMTGTAPSGSVANNFISSGLNMVSPGLFGGTSIIGTSEPLSFRELRDIKNRIKDEQDRRENLAGNYKSGVDEETGTDRNYGPGGIDTAGDRQERDGRDSEGAGNSDGGRNDSAGGDNEPSRGGRGDDHG